MVAVVRNPGLVLDAGLPDRIAAALETLPAPDTWSIAGAGGLGLHDRRHLAIYASASPAIPLGASMQPLLDVMPDLFIVNAAFARRTLAVPMAIPDAAFETTLVVEGYLDGRAALFLPGLTAGIDGTFLARDLDVLDRAVSDRFASRLPGHVVQTLAGDIKIRAGDTNAPPPASDPTTDRSSNSSASASLV